MTTYTPKKIHTLQSVLQHCVSEAAAVFDVEPPAVTVPTWKDVANQIGDVLANLLVLLLLPACYVVMAVLNERTPRRQRRRQAALSPRPTENPSVEYSYIVLPQPPAAAASMLVTSVEVLAPIQSAMGASMSESSTVNEPTSNPRDLNAEHKVVETSGPDPKVLCQAAAERTTSASPEYDKLPLNKLLPIAASLGLRHRKVTKADLIKSIRAAMAEDTSAAQRPRVAVEESPTTNNRRRPSQPKRNATGRTKSRKSK